MNVALYRQEDLWPVGVLKVQQSQLNYCLGFVVVVAAKYPLLSVLPATLASDN